MNVGYLWIPNKPLAPQILDGWHAHSPKQCDSHAEYTILRWNLNPSSRRRLQSKNVSWGSEQELSTAKDDAQVSNLITKNDELSAADTDSYSKLVIKLRLSNLMKWNNT